MEFSTGTSNTNLSGASGSRLPEAILQGVPVPPGTDISALHNHPYFLTTSVWIPGDIVDPISIERLSRLNKFLVIHRKDFCNNILQPEYIRFLQRELDGTPPELLPTKLDSLLSREYNYWYRSYAPTQGLPVPNHDWYINEFGPFVPSPVEPVVYDLWFFVFLGILGVFSISLFYLVRQRRKSKRRKGASPGPGETGHL